MARTQHVIAVPFANLDAIHIEIDTVAVISFQASWGCIVAVKAGWNSIIVAVDAFCSA